MRIYFNELTAAQDTAMQVHQLPVARLNPINRSKVHVTRALVLARGSQQIQMP
jgi:hypothetical protein